MKTLIVIIAAAGAALPATKWSKPKWSKPKWSKQ